MALDWMCALLPPPPLRPRSLPPCSLLLRAKMQNPSAEPRRCFRAGAGPRAEGLWVREEPPSLQVENHRGLMRRMGEAEAQRLCDGLKDTEPNGAARGFERGPHFLAGRSCFYHESDQKQPWGGGRWWSLQMEEEVEVDYNF